MKYQKVTVFSLILVVISATSYYVFFKRAKFFTGSNAATGNTAQVATSDTPSEQTAIIGDVTYKVTPKSFLSSARTWDFEFVLDIHSGTLDQDLLQLISMVDEKGQKYQPVKWEGDPPQGHHRRGVLKFRPIYPKPQAIELKISQVGEVTNGKFKWEVN